MRGCRTCESVRMTWTNEEIATNIRKVCRSDNGGQDAVVAWTKKFVDGGMSDRYAKQAAAIVIEHVRSRIAGIRSAQEPSLSLLLSRANGAKRSTRSKRSV